MPIPETDRCETCRFWTPVTKGYADGKEHMECRLRGPTIEGMRNQRFPITPPTQGCGDHKPIPEG